jgi:hypothetical protein
MKQIASRLIYEGSKQSKKSFEIQSDFFRNKKHRIQNKACHEAVAVAELVEASLVEGIL